VEAERLRTVIDDEGFGHVSVDALDVLEVAAVEVYTRVTEQAVVEQPVFAVEAVEQSVGVQLLARSVDHHLEVFAAPLEELPHERPLLHLNGLPVFVHFDQEDVVRVVLRLHRGVD